MPLLRVSTMVLLCWALFWPLLPTSAHAFKDVDHAFLTRQSWTLYRQWLEAGGRNSAIADPEAIVQGTIAEDAVTLTRARNWHFFNPAGRLENGWVFQRSSAARLADLIKALQQALAERASPAATGLLAGRILHHLQDMSVPAHAIPIYHGPGKLDAFERFSEANKDRFPNPVPLAAVGPLLRSLPAKYAGQLPHFLYARDARRTIATRQLPLAAEGPLAALRWGDFWIACDPAAAAQTCNLHQKGFGLYSDLGYVFGAAVLETPEGSRAVDPRLYDAYYRRQQRQAIQTTLEWLHLYDLQLQQAAGGEP